jgi:hypothetical protein
MQQVRDATRTDGTRLVMSCAQTDALICLADDREVPSAAVSADSVLEALSV